MYTACTVGVSGSSLIHCIQVVMEMLYLCYLIVLVVVSISIERLIWICFVCGTVQRNCLGLNGSVQKILMNHSDLSCE